jgi:hypothetical protein
MKVKLIVRPTERHFPLWEAAFCDQESRAACRGAGAPSFRMAGYSPSHQPILVMSVIGMLQQLVRGRSVSGVHMTVYEQGGTLRIAKTASFVVALLSFLESKNQSRPLTLLLQSQRDGGGAFQRRTVCANGDGTVSRRRSGV